MTIGIAAKMDANSEHRRELRKHVPHTDGVPNYLLSTVTMLQAAFPKGMTIDSNDYPALYSFLDNEGLGFRSIAEVLDFAFHIGYVDVIGAFAVIEDDTVRQMEIERIEAMLSPHGLAQWRTEDDSSRGAGNVAP